MAIQTKQQKRAAFALKQIKNLKGTDGKEFHELANFIVGVPNMILSNGLGQTLAFLLAKKDGKQKKTFTVIKGWLECSDNHFFTAVAKDEMDFLTQFTTVSQKIYLDMQDETLRLMEWLKRYARAFDDFKE